MNKATQNTTKNEQTTNSAAKPTSTSTKLSIPISRRFHRPNPLAGGNVA